MKFLAGFRLSIVLWIVFLLGSSSVMSQKLPSGANFQAGVGEINYHNSSVYIRQGFFRAIY